MDKIQKPTTKPKTPRGVKTVIPLAAGKEISIYAGKRVSDALAEISRIRLSTRAFDYLKF